MKINQNLNSKKYKLSNVTDTFDNNQYFGKTKFVNKYNMKASANFCCIKHSKISVHTNRRYFNFKSMSLVKNVTLTILGVRHAAVSALSWNGCRTMKSRCWLENTSWSTTPPTSTGPCVTEDRPDFSSRLNSRPNAFTTLATIANVASSQSWNPTYRLIAFPSHKTEFDPADIFSNISSQRLIHWKFCFKFPLGIQWQIKFG